MFTIPVTGFPPENVLIVLVFNFMQGKVMASNGFPCTCYLYVVECLANDDRQRDDIQPPDAADRTGQSNTADNAHKKKIYFMYQI